MIPRVNGDARLPVAPVMRANTFLPALLLLLGLVASPCTAAELPQLFPVTEFGAKGDGKTDDTAAFQMALDAAHAAGGGTVHAPRGNYFFAGSLNVPRAVTLEGIWQSVPAHNGLRDAGLPKPTDDGTTFLVTANAGKEDAAPFITLNTNATLKGVVLYYPEQNINDVPNPYPWAIALRGKNPAVLDCELLNPYNGIDASHNERHLVRNVQGQPLRRGVYVDHIYDIGRLENVHFNPWWSMQPKLFAWQKKHGEAFIFGKSDWQYVLNTFCFGYQVGYRFIETKSGHCNGNFLGIGADDCHRAVQVDQSNLYGLLITNGEFVAFKDEDPVQVVVNETNTGKVRFVNCAFWGQGKNVARVAGKGLVGFSDCTFVQWDRDNENRPAIDATSGTLLVRGCEFREDKPQVRLGPGVKKAIVSDNVITGPLRVANEAKNANVQMHGNAAD